MRKTTSEAYLDSLLGKKGSIKRKSARQYIIEHQDEMPLTVIVAYLNSIKEGAIINDGRIVNFSR